MRHRSTSWSPTSAAASASAASSIPRTSSCRIWPGALGRPVKWVEERREHFLAINHSREQQWSIAVGVDARGRLLALDATLINVLGAYLRTHGVWVPALTAAYLPGPYRLPSFRCHVSCVMTNKTPTGTVRGPGFFEGSFVRER